MPKSLCWLINALMLISTAFKYSIFIHILYEDQWEFIFKCLKLYLNENITLLNNISTCRWQVYRLFLEWYRINFQMKDFSYPQLPANIVFRLSAVISIDRTSHCSLQPVWRCWVPHNSITHSVCFLTMSSDWASSGSYLFTIEIAMEFRNNCNSIE